MYEATFGFHKRPFAAVPRIDQYFPASAIETARMTLARCIERGEGAGMVVGPSGTGKTLLCQLLAEQFKDAFAVARLPSGRLSTRRALFQAILYELGLPFRDMDEGELRLALIDHLAQGERCPHGMLLMIDEAHTLPLRLLEEVRMITNLVADGQPRVRLVLLGNAVLEERFASPKLESFSQRLVGRCYLESYNREETEQFIHAQLHATGGDPGIISSDACCSVYQATDGVPRLINQVCDHALLLCYAAGRRQISSMNVEEAWADLQQLPTPWNADCPDNREASNVIEFGGLDDEPADLDEPAATSSIEPEVAASVESEFESEFESFDEVEETPPRALRVARYDDEVELDPVAQLDQLQQDLARLDDDFEPIGSIGPEVELVFDSPANPFDEEFDEEEVVICRYGSTAEKYRDEPLPSCATAVAEAATVVPKPAAQETTGEVESVSASPDLTPTETDEEQQLADDVAEMGQTVEAMCSEPDLSDDSVAWDTEPDTVPLHRQSDAEPVEAEEQEMIVVEEGYEKVEATHKRPAPVVRRQEYGQLFARLRRSS